MEPASKTGRYRRYRRRKARPVRIAFLRREYRHCRRARRRGFARLLTERSVSTSVPEFARLFAGGESHERTRLGSGFRSSQKSESDFQRFLDDSGLGKRGFARKINAVRWTSLGFPPYKIGRFGPNLCKTSGFLANYGSKAHDISSLGRNDQSGCCGRHTLFNCGRSLRVPCRHRCQKRTPNPLTRGASLMRASEPQHAKRGVFLFIIKIVILMLVA